MLRLERGLGLRLRFWLGLVASGKRLGLGIERGAGMERGLGLGLGFRVSGCQGVSVIG